MVLNCIVLVLSVTALNEKYVSQSFHLKQFDIVLMCCCLSPGGVTLCYEVAENGRCVRDKTASEYAKVTQIGYGQSNTVSLLL